MQQARAVAIDSTREKRGSVREDAEIHARIAGALPLLVEIRLPSGAVISVDNRPLARLLEPVGQRAGRRKPMALSRRAWDAAAERRAFVAAVDGLLAATAVAPPALDRARADQALRQVLSRPEYSSREHGPSWIERFALWLERMLRRWFPGSGRAVSGDRLARWLLAGVVALLALLVVRIALLVLPNLTLRLPHYRAGSAGGQGELLVPQEPAALLAEAEREATAGRYREALRLVYLALVLRLDRAGVLPEDRSRTHWELLRELRRRAKGEWSVTSNEDGPAPSSLITRYSSLVSVLSPLTRRLDERLYGGRTATAEDFQVCRAAHDEIERLLCAPA